VKNRWTALAVIFLSFIQFTLNWFNVVPTFSSLAAEMHLTLAQIGVVVGLFIAGYGLAHIPGGMIAEAFGMRFAMLLGIAVETIGITKALRARHRHEGIQTRQIACIVRFSAQPVRIMTTFRARMQRVSLGFLFRGDRACPAFTGPAHSI
jgi:MFS family permease